MHGLGPHNISVGGRQTTVRQELKETYSYLEEAKADISALFALRYLIDKGSVPKALERSLYTTYLASAFRSIRFGVNEAHGRGMAIQLNYLLDAGAFTVHPDGTFAVNRDRIGDGVTALTREIMTIEAEGDYAKAKTLGERLGVMRPPVQRALENSHPFRSTSSPLYDSRTASRFVALTSKASAAKRGRLQFIEQDPGPRGSPAHATRHWRVRTRVRTVASLRCQTELFVELFARAARTARHLPRSREEFEVMAAAAAYSNKGMRYILQPDSFDVHASRARGKGVV